MRSILFTTQIRGAGVAAGDLVLVHERVAATDARGGVDDLHDDVDALDRVADEVVEPDARAACAACGTRAYR